MNDIVYNYLSVISGFCSLIPLTLGLINFKTRLPFLFPFYILIILSLITDVTSEYLLMNEKNNLFLFRLFTALEFTLIISSYYIFYKELKYKQVLLLLIPVFISIAFLDWFVNGMNSFDNYATATEALILTTVSLVSFYLIIKHSFFTNPLLEPFFWINSSVLLYFGGNLVLFIFNNYLLKNKTSGFMAMWTIHSCLNILYNCLIAIAFWKTRRP